MLVKPKYVQVSGLVWVYVCGQVVFSVCDMLNVFVNMRGRRCVVQRLVSRPVEICYKFVQCRLYVGHYELNA